MAPEIGEGKYGKAVDIYAMVILFEMLTGNPPYVGESLGEVLIKHLTQKPDVDGLNPVFGRVITKAMERKPEDRYQSVDEMLHALCPDDHSSYLPAPASLSMIGDRAANRRAKPSAQMQSAGIEDTFVKMPSLVDTREDSQSQPFERPVSTLPSSLRGWLDHAGLWWQPPNEELEVAESVSWPILALAAVLVSSCFTVLVGTMGDMAWSHLLAWFVFVSAPGFVACWAFLQMLPRSNSLGWMIGNRLIGAGIVCGIAVIIKSFEFSTGVGRIDEEFLLVPILGSMLIDWRCFISTSRYPRVGILKTLVVLLVFFIAIMIWAAGAAPQEPVLMFLMIVAPATLIIQILAPHGRVRVEHSPERVEVEQKAQEIKHEAPISETRFDNESFVLKEEV